ncbi:MAG: Hint domain-containing protein [Pseudomonadota bacterium]
MPDPFLSEIKYLGNANVDFIEVAVDAGTDVSDLVVTVYRPNGTIRSTSDLSLLTPTTVNGFDVYLIENSGPTAFNGVGLNQAVALSDSTTVYQFVSFSDNPGGVTAGSGPAAGLTSTEIGQAGAGSSLETQDQGGSYFEQTNPDPSNVTCFVNGTRIETEDGLIAVEDLTPGMRVRTLEGRHAPLRMILSRAVTRTDMVANDALRPVRISAGSLGQGIPQRDVLVSRQHRMLVASPITQRMFGRDGALVAAIRLTDIPGVYVDLPDEDIEYFHLLFDEHEVIFADGAPSESFFPGEVALRSLPRESRREISLIFPDLTLPLRVEHSKHLIPKRRHQARLVARHAKNRKTLVHAP